MNPPDAPLYEIKANLFRALAHPVRVRVLEILATSPQEVAVADLLTTLGLEPSHLSGHLAVLRRHDVVTSRRVGSTVYYRLGHPAVADVLASARVFLHDTLATAAQRLDAARDLPPVGR
ncbi:MAG TPA: transcriptional regulator [Micrococcales bacterium]|uniref:ArsR/SmtB family transcription factor n=1 Tax=Miniimonas arenae TaxID=676201 RepID=UPI000EC3C558|nr:metalloregulator ArsR/SmtB family transcription factor [Miniimonas arenae]HCX86094.1 transcriptional regulator [Micrococcales bacterium]